MFNIRKATQNDLEGIKEIYSLYYKKQEDLDYFTNRARQFTDSDPEAVALDTEYLVAEENGEIVGVIGFRKPPQKLMPFVHTQNPVEIYMLMVRGKKSGVGSALVVEMTKISKEKGYFEIVLYSSGAWKDSWGFYDRLGFNRVGNIENLDHGTAQIFNKDL